MDKSDIVTYEIANSPIAPYISNKWLQEQLAKYYAKKASRKYRKYLLFLAIKRVLWKN